MMRLARKISNGPTAHRHEQLVGEILRGSCSSERGKRRPFLSLFCYVFLRELRCLFCLLIASPALHIYTPQWKREQKESFGA